MKPIVRIAVILLCAAVLLPAADGRFFVSAGAAALMPGDSAFADIYGEVQISPELRAGYHLYPNFYFWLGGSFFTSTVTIPLLQDKMKVSQNFLALGAGWETRRGRRFQADISAALLLAGFKEKAFGATVSKSSLGIELGSGLRYSLKKNIFLELALGYVGAWTTARTEAGETDIVLGGLRLGSRLGFRF